MAVSVTIAGTDRWNKVSADTVEITKRLGARQIAEFTTLDPAASGMYRPAVDDTVTIAEGGTTYFGGLINEIDETPFSDVRGAVVRVGCGDYNQYAEWRVVKKDYAAGQTLKAVLSDLVTTYLAVFGVSADPAMATGPTLGALSYDYRRLADVLDELCTIAGWVRWIDSSKVLHAQAGASGGAAPFSITESSPKYREGTWHQSQTRTDYRNRQYVRFGSGEKWIDLESHPGDGSTREWALDYPVKTQPGYIRVTVGGSPVDWPCGIYGVDDMPWTFRWSDAKVVQRADQPVLTGADTMAASYLAVFPAVVSDEDAAEIAAKGPREWPVVEASDLFDRATALDLAEGLIRRYARTPPRVIGFETFETGAVPGQILSVNLPTSRGISSASFLITEVKLRHEVGLDWISTITAVEGDEPTTEWDELYKSWGGGGMTPVVIGSGGSGGGGGGPSGQAALVVFLGGSSSESFTHTTGAWVAPPHQVRIWLRDTWFPDGRATIHLLVKNESGGSCTPRLYNYTAGASQGAGPESSATTWTEIAFIVTLATGFKQYGLELQVGNGGKEIWTIGTLATE